MPSVTPPIAVFSTAAFFFTAYVICRIILNQRVQHHQRRTARTSAAYGVNPRCNYKTGITSQTSQLSRIIEMNCGSINSEDVDVVGEGCDIVIYSLKKKRDPFSNKWTLLDQNNQVIGGIKLHEHSFFLNNFASKNIATIDLVNPTLGRRRAFLEKQTLLNRPYAVNFDYMYSHFTWVKQKSKKLQNLRSTSESVYQSFPVEKSLQIARDQCDECIVAMAIPNNALFPQITYTISYDALLIDADAIVATLFSIISSLGSSGEELRDPMALIGTQLECRFSSSN